MISRIIKLFTNEWLIIGAILGNSVLLFLLGYVELHNDPLLNILDHGFTIFFMLEVLVKVGMKGWKQYISDSWNRFDFILVAISVPSLFELIIDIPDLSYLLVFRLLRVMRILRFMRFIPNISKMMAGIARAFRASIFVLAALVIYNVLLAILASHLFRNEAPEMFGNPGISLLSIFQVFTLEGWNEMPSTIIAASDPTSWKPLLTRVFFFVVVLTGGIFGMSIMNAVFVDEMVMDNNDGIENKIDDINRKLDQLAQRLNDQDGSNSES
ncbi:MAG: voltage-gated sodium channel [Marinoscillum sp.]|jgi:voltage-gated sodium channel